MPIGSVPKIKTSIPTDPTRSVVTNTAPPDNSIYSNPVSALSESRSPITSQVGGSPSAKIVAPNASSVDGIN